MRNDTGVPKTARLWLVIGASIVIGMVAGCMEPAGRSEDASTADPVSDDVEYLHQLGQVRGHLAAFTALHRMGAHEMSMTHAKHPESELYAGLVPAFAARGKAGFAEELDALTDAVSNGGNVDATYVDVINAIRTNEPDVDLATRLKAIAALARTAGDEFAIGVADDGAVVNVHEYQDAWGFLTAAREMLAATGAATGRRPRRWLSPTGNLKSPWPSSMP